MPGTEYRFVVQQEEIVKHADGRCRLDKFVLAQDEIVLSRSQVRRLILDCEITVNGQSVKPGYWLKPCDEIAVTLPEPRPSVLAAENIPLDILYEDKHLLVLNKPAGMVVHPAPGHDEGTLVHALLHHCQRLSGIGGVQRPGIVHRLDLDTSGVMLVAKTDLAHAGLSAQLSSRELIRLYCAVVHGRFRSLSGSVEAPVGRHRRDRKKMAVDQEQGRYAVTYYQIVEQFAEHAVVRLELKTGRTHQIRVHMKHIHHPVVGDPVYGTSSKNNLDMPRQALHAQRVTFMHPVTNEKMSFETRLPEDMQQLIEKLRAKEYGSKVKG